MVLINIILNSSILVLLFILVHKKYTLNKYIKKHLVTTTTTMVDYDKAEQLVKDKQFGIARNKEGIITGCEHYEPEEVLANHFKKISICAKCRHKSKCEIIANDIKKGG